MSSDWLIIEGARQNNLRNISLKLPHNSVIAVTGISGSGKSSLAFDTIFAEGQWRFIESLSTYARLFIEKLDRPDVDSIKNIRPAIALEQHNPVRGSRSTVGTITEIYDLLRVLYARVATPFCPECGQEIIRWSPSGVIEDLVRHYNGRKAAIIFESHLTPEELIRNGFSRVLVSGEIRDIKELKEEIRSYPVVADRLVIGESKRLSDSVETAWRFGRGAVKFFFPPSETKTYSSGNICDNCGYEAHETTPILFSFNHPLGACPVCKGFGNILKYSPDLVIPDHGLSLSKGAIEPWEKPAARWWKKQMIKNAGKAGLDTHTPYGELPQNQKEMVFNGTEHFYGLNAFFDELEQRRYKIHVRVFLSRYRTGVTCPECNGKRLKKEALSYRIGDRDIADLAAMKIGDLNSFFNAVPLSGHRKEVGRDALVQIGLKLGYLSRVGLDYLSLSRPSRTLSGGEFQRINLSNQLASHLTGTLYVLDEPTVGLHARDTGTISAIMHQLAGLGNTVVVVEHDPSIIKDADWVVEMGPGGGQDGGGIVYSGSRKEFLEEDTLTARYMKGALSVGVAPPKRNKHNEFLVLEGASGNNLKDVTLKLPLQALTAITGVSGSGKSSLIVDTLYRALSRKMKIAADIPLPYGDLYGTDALKDVKLMDQSPIGRSPRSNPATYLGIFDSVRKLFSGTPEAKSKGLSSGFFSFNVPGGRCEECRGEGFQKIEMYFFEDVFITCPACNGTRYSPEALRIVYRSKSISDVLKMTVSDARTFFSEPRVLNALDLLDSVGLGYLRLGQPATTLSGGEAQRMKLCAELGKTTRGNTLYILDEPTVGLHMHDISKLSRILRMLVDRGDTVVIIEHNLDLIRIADWIIDMGPEGGDRGGEIVFEGSPEDILNSDVSITGKYLRNE